MRRKLFTEEQILASLRQAEWLLRSARSFSRAARVVARIPARCCRPRRKPQNAATWISSRTHSPMAERSCASP